MERRLLWFTIIQALPMLLELLRTLLQFLFVSILHVPGAIGVTSETLFYYMDITCTLPPYCLLATNANIRRLLLPRAFAIEEISVFEDLGFARNPISVLI
ncbi:unnamed protein product, partial [Mesorhabditis belari]|uniref:Uncharacterized protein n=1 Tax=Mesorhabditis belari TaxID=2138241 RepID=A0AAF3FMB0_9BILA